MADPADVYNYTKTGGGPDGAGIVSPRQEDGKRNSTSGREGLARLTGPLSLRKVSSQYRQIITRGFGAGWILKKRLV